MARWGLIISAIFIIISLFLASGVFTYYAGDEHWKSDKAGFFTGIIHGIIAPLMLVAAIFTEYSMYELNNSGWFYNFGFLIGLLAVWGGGSSTQNVVKNYYSSRGKDAKNNLSEEDHQKIGAIIEEKIRNTINPKFAKKGITKTTGKQKR